MKNKHVKKQVAKKHYIEKTKQKVQFQNLMLLDDADFKGKSTLEDMQNFAEESYYGVLGDTVLFIDFNDEETNERMKTSKNKDIKRMWKKANDAGARWLMHLIW